MIRWLCQLVVRCFFARIQVTNPNFVPASGPVIFYGNHQNQFVDAMILFSQTRRAVSFLMAASSYSKFYGLLGSAARAMRAIPVRRRIDEARAGTGRATVADFDTTSSASTSLSDAPAAAPPPGAGATVRLLGVEGTRFDEELSEGCQVDLGVHGVAEPPTVSKVISATEALLVGYCGQWPEEPRRFKILPKINQSEVFESVVGCLDQGGCIGIFPEGGSHDRSEILPLKSGIAVMALKAAESGKAAPVLVPVGLNYFSGHRFRSRVIVEFGRPFTVSEEILALYQHDKRAATVHLMADIEESLRNVTLNAASYQELELLTLLRRLYQPEHIQLSPSEYMRLNRRFITGYERFKGDQRLQPLKERVIAYSTQLATLGLTDAHIIDPTPVNFRENALILVWRALMLFLLCLVALPAILLNVPILGFVRWYSNKQAKIALAKSSVKISGKDVIASNKIILSFLLLPVSYVIYSLLVALFFGWTTALIFFFLLPLATTISIKFMENGVLIWKSSLPLLFSLMKTDYQKQFVQLKEDRARLQADVRQIVESLGPELGSKFWDDRVIPPNYESTPQAAPNSTPFAKILPIPIRRSWGDINQRLIDPRDPFIASMLEDESEII